MLLLPALPVLPVLLLVCCVALTLSPPPLAAAGLEVSVEARIMPYGRELGAAVWARYRIESRFVERHYDLPAESGRTVLRPSVTFARFAAEDVSAELEAVFFPAVIYVGRSCPPQQLAELSAVQPSRGRTERRPVPVAEGVRRGGWVGFEPAGADRLTARYQCFPAAHRPGPDEHPPPPDLPPPLQPSEPTGRKPGDPS